MARAAERAPRLTDVARLAGVSPATASRALHGTDRDVREENRQKVLAAAQSLGYAPNIAARAFAQGRTRGVSLIVGAVPDDYANPIVAGVMAATSRRNLPVTITPAGDDVDSMVAQIQQVRGMRSEILLLAGGRHASDRANPALIDALKRFESEGGRAVVMSQPGLPFDTVSYDNFGGGHDMAVALRGLGYDRFAVISGQMHAMTQRDRVQGFIAGLQESGVELSPDRLLTGGFTRDGAYAMTGELLRRGIAVDAIFAGNDSMALGAMTFLRDANQQGKIAVAGFDDMVALRDVTPSLTTVHLPWDEVAEHALGMAMLPRQKDPRSVMVRGHVVVRESTPACAVTTA
ncbi:LacI family DNA-binding transcriptional regulator [Microbacterium sp. LWS13-1.2]|uniref:LacI family transcriptional regulator n=1 Tax=Microbacterium sp. LWS13-1.2 TaxID=3135264 RepID=A0AAU6SDQ4_9MICO